MFISLNRFRPSAARSRSSAAFLLPAAVSGWARLLRNCCKSWTFMDHLPRNQFIHQMRENRTELGVESRERVPLGGLGKLRLVGDHLLEVIHRQGPARRAHLAQPLPDALLGNRPAFFVGPTLVADDAYLGQART